MARADGGAVRAGLGEMMPTQLWDTTLDPAQRMLKRLTVDEAAEANIMFSLLMGDKVSQHHSARRGNCDQGRSSTGSHASSLDRGNDDVDGGCLTC